MAEVQWVSTRLTRTKLGVGGAWRGRPGPGPPGRVVGVPRPEDASGTLGQGLLLPAQDVLVPDLGAQAVLGRGPAILAVGGLDQMGMGPLPFERPARAQGQVLAEHLADQVD